jgi:16S rRNA (uracil1498-N3)-methyltransferase
MSIHRFYLAPERWQEESPTLDPVDSHHCADVLRLEVGEKVTLFDGEGSVADAELTGVHRKHCTVRIGERSVTPPLRCSITLAQAVPKGKNMDLILQKGVELGASTIVPLLTRRTVVRLDAKEGSHKQERWQQIALEACKQCGRNQTPVVTTPCTLEEFLRQPREGVLLLASLQPGAVSIKEALAKATTHSLVTVLVGPEGDFTPEESAMALQAGAIPVTLGPMILRAETAALFCLSVLGHELL